MLKSILVAVFVAFLCTIAYGDTIVLTNGGKLHGKIIKEDEKEVTIQLPNKGTITVNRDQIKSMEKNEIEGPKIPPPSQSPLVPREPVKKPEDKKEDKEPEEKKPETKPDEKEGQLDPELKKRIEQLVAQLGHRKPSWRSNAKAELAKIGKAATPMLLKALDTGATTWARSGAAEVLGNIREEKAIDYLIRILGDPDRFVRDESSKALRKITGKNFGFDPFSSPQNREAAAKKWEEWWEKEKQKQKEEEEKKKEEERKKNEELEKKKAAKQAREEKEKESQPKPTRE
jgi:hypothetical protein